MGPHLYSVFAEFSKKIFKIHSRSLVTLKTIYTNAVVSVQNTSLIEIGRVQYVSGSLILLSLVALKLLHGLI